MTLFARERGQFRATSEPREGIRAGAGEKCPYFHSPQTNNTC